MRLRDYIAIAILVLGAIASYTMTAQEDGQKLQTRRPDPTQIGPLKQEPRIGISRSKSRRPIPDEQPNDPRIVVKVEKKESSSMGTAFSIDPSGIWVTAHHVTSDCDLLGLEKSDRRLIRVVELTERPDADISILRTQGGAPFLKVVKPGFRMGDEGYSFGFPKGSPGAVYGKVLGRARMQTRGRYRKDEPVLVWTQIRRVPDLGADLRGISGGPWVDKAGNVIGVHVAGAPRRGRSYSTAPRTLLAAIEESGVSMAKVSRGQPPKANLTPHRFAQYGESLRRDLTVAKVVCLVGEKWRWLAGQSR